MKIVIIHNLYRQSGGEDVVVQSESKLLKDKGHDVELYLADNRDLSEGLLSKIKTAWNVAWSNHQKLNLQKFLQKHKPDIVHVHNFFPLLTPSIFSVCRELGLPVVHTLHNYRLICPSALLMIDGKIYEKSIKKSAYWTVLKKVYRNSILGTLAVARMVEYHKKRGTWRNEVDQFIALTQFAKSKFAEAGFPSHKISVKPNFMSDPFIGKFNHFEKRHGALFVGRISLEKGIGTLEKAWADLNYPLSIAGDGPLCKEFDQNNSAIIKLGRLSPSEINKQMRRSVILVMPSECYETFGLVIIEAFANGLPVLASKLGAMAELVEDKYTGLHFEPGNSRDLSKKARWMIEHPQDCMRMGLNARKVYEEKYTPEANYRQLIDIYQHTIATKQKINEV